MAKDPAFLFYTGDFSTGTQFFSDEQLGKYVRLLMAQHQHGHLTEKQMLHICKSYDNDIFIKFKKDDNDMFFNERLELEIFKRKKYTDSRSNNKSGRKSSLNKESTKNTSKSYDNHMENVNVNRNEDKDFERGVGKTFEITEPTEREKEITETAKHLISCFGWNEIRDFAKMSEARMFLVYLDDNGSMEWFVEQFNNYFEYKKLSKENSHNLTSFIGTPAKEYQNGGWNAAVWSEKLKNYQFNGTKQSTPDAKRASRYEVANKLGDMLKGNTGE